MDNELNTQIDQIINDQLNEYDCALFVAGE